MKLISEWTFEGSLKSRTCIYQLFERVWLVGNRTRYQSGMYNYVHAKWTEVNLSGTALMNISVSGRKA